MVFIPTRIMHIFSFSFSINSPSYSDHLELSGNASWLGRLSWCKQKRTAAAQLAARGLVFHLKHSRHSVTLTLYVWEWDNYLTA